MGVIQQLEQKVNFTGTEAAISDYILGSPDNVKNMGIVDLARATFSSNAAIIRMCRKLGLAGYKEFRIAFSADLEKVRHKQADVDVHYPFVELESTDSIMRSLAHISQSAIEECYATVSPSRLNRAARLLLNAKRILAYAAGDTLITTTGFSNQMSKIGRTTVFPARYLESAQLTSGSTSQDAALIVSYSGVILASMKRELQVLKRNQTPIIVISTLKECPYADLLITIPGRERRVGKIGGFYSQSAIRYVLNCLYGSIYSLDLQKNKNYKDKMDSYAYDGDGGK